MDATVELKNGEFGCVAGPMSALCLSILVGHCQIARVLLERGANIQWRHPMCDLTPVFIAAQEGHAEVVRLLAELGVNVETPDNDGATPAYIAAQEGHVEVFCSLAELGVNVQTPDNDGCTPALSLIHI